MIINVEDYLDSLGVRDQVNRFVIAHYGTPRRSGRYPWGSGGNENNAKDGRSFLETVAGLKAKGLSDVEIALGMGMTTTELRTSKSIAKNAEKAANITMANRLAAKGMSNGAIAERLGLPGESSVRALRAAGVQDKVDILQSTAQVLRDRVDTGAYIDVGTGVEHHLPGVSRQKLNTAVALLEQEGYSLVKVQEDQIGSPGNKTTIKVLAPPGTVYRDIVTNKQNIQQINAFSDDGGRSYHGIQKPLDISLKRVDVNYKEDGGDKADGVIYVRPGVDDVSIGNARYAQVRISVEGTHYLKGMAVYKDDLPPGVDLQFNTNKSNTGNKLDAMKSQKDDPENPFGATIRQRIDEATGRVTSVMNIVGYKDGSGEEGSWDTWSRNLPSQFLSKQSNVLAQQQLAVTQERKRQELDEILALTNPGVRKKLLESYSDGADSAAVHLKAAAMPRQSTHVIMPVNSLKDNEVYAPNFDNGDRVALVRFPHGGTFEIPELTVNNRHKDSIALLGKQASDAIGINANVASRLSGADFDGDTVLVIRNNDGRVKSTPALEKLKNFEPTREYPAYDGMKTMDGGTWNAKTKKVDFPEGKKPNSRNKGSEMGQISNLITDMTIKGATTDELARAVKHSMVVIDAEKHSLNYKQSALDNNIKQLKIKYQDGAGRGAATLISRATSPERVNKMKPRPERDKEGNRLGGPIDRATGKRMFVPTDEKWEDPKTGKTVYKKEAIAKLANTDDAHTLLSSNGGTQMEKIYADHSNVMKSLANEARRAMVHTPSTPMSSSAKAVFKDEVASLSAKLALAEKNRPLERQAQVIANSVYRQKLADNPGMDSDQIKKTKFQALAAARIRTGASKNKITITDDEWLAIQAGAISNKKLSDILNNADLEQVKQLATPKQDVLMSTAMATRAASMAALGYTQAEIASQLGVSLTTLKRSLG